MKAGHSETMCRDTQRDFRVHPLYQVALNVDGRLVAFQLDTGDAVKFITEEYVPSDVRYVPLKPVVRRLTGQSLNSKGLYVMGVKYKTELSYLPVNVVRRSQRPTILG